MFLPNKKLPNKKIIVYRSYPSYTELHTDTRYTVFFKTLPYTNKLLDREYARTIPDLSLKQFRHESTRR